MTINQQEKLTKLINNKIRLIRVAYIREYRDLISMDEQEAEDIIRKLEERLKARIYPKINEIAIDRASTAEFSLLHLLKRDPKKLAEKKKTSFFSRGLKKTLKMLSDNDISGYAARHSPVNHTIMDVGTTTPTDTAIDTIATDYAAIGIQGVNTLAVPFLYLYYYARKEPIPFTIKNNSKFILSGIALALGIVSLTIPPVGAIIALVTAGIGVGTSIYALGKFIYERAQINRTKQAIEDNLSKNIEEIRSAKAAIHETKESLLEEIMKAHPDIPALETKRKKLVDSYEKLQTNQIQLKERIKDRHALALDAGKEKTIYGAISNSMKVLLGCAIIAGLVLSFIPFTAPIGLPLVIAAAATGIALYAANKIHHARMTNKQKAGAKADIDMQLTRNDDVLLEPSSTLKAAGVLNNDLKPAVVEAEKAKTATQTETPSDTTAATSEVAASLSNKR